jgi:hypothetical protein
MVGKKEGGQGIEEREEGETSRCRLQGGLLGLEAASRRWPCSVQESSTQVLPVTHEEDNRLFAKSPLAIGDFSEMF